MTAILAWRVFSKRDKKPVDIKPNRFNPEFHSKIPGENPRMIEIDGTPITEKIVLDPILGAVQAGEHKAAVETEEAQLEIKSKLAEENTFEDPQDEEKEAIGPSPYDTLSDDALKLLAKEKGLKLSPNIGRKKLLEKLVATE